MSEQLEKQVVAIGIPVTDSVKTWFAMDFTRLMLYMQRTRPNVTIIPLVSEGSLIPQQRQMLVAGALKVKATHLLWLDSDMRFPNNLLARLMDRNVDIVGANYSERRKPYRPVAFRNWNDMNLRAYTTPDSTGLERVAAIGSGALLVKMDVYRKLDIPHYLVGWSTAKAAFLGEDMYFCFKAGQDGYEIFVDHDVSQEVHHVGGQTFTNRDSYDYALAFPDEVAYTPDETHPHEEIPALVDPFGAPLAGRVRPLGGLTQWQS
jgi:hypothetical protein